MSQDKQQVEQKSMEESILQSLPWRCFHCDFVTNDPKEAEAHFGDRDDAEEFKPLCRWWERMSDNERAEALQDVIVQLNEERRENMQHRTAIEGLEYQVSTLPATISSYRPFRNCNSMYDVFCVYDSMEGRALAAEEKLRNLEEKHVAE